MSGARKRWKSVNFDEQIPKKMFQMQITIYFRQMYVFDGIFVFFRPTILTIFFLCLIIFKCCRLRALV